MTIKQQGGIFGRNPTFNDVTVDNDLTVNGTTIQSGTQNITGQLNVDNVRLDGNEVSATDTNGSLTLNANGSGKVRSDSQSVFLKNNSVVFPTVYFCRDSDADIKGYIGSNNTSFSMKVGTTTVDPVEFVVNSTAMGNFDINGNLNVSYGNLKIGTAGKGIDFSATSGTGTSELFDDYEEGSWTPTTAGDATGALSAVVGQYTKIGNVVHCYVAFDVSTNFTSNAIGGLPYTPNNTATVSGVQGLHFIYSSTVQTGGLILNGSNNISLKDVSTNANHNPNTTANIYRGYFSYRTA